jgi:uncharacterized protein (DUF1697 family)
VRCWRRWLKKHNLARYIAFLRAINVTGRYITMQRLREAFEGIPGLSRVETFINSGNVLFDAQPSSPAELEAEIEARLLEALGFATPTFLRSAPQMAELAAIDAFSDQEDDPSDVLYVVFLRAGLSPEQAARLETLSTPVDSLRPWHNHVFWRFRRSLSPDGRSTLTIGQIERASGPGTARNITTVRKIEAKLWS